MGNNTGVTTRARLLGYTPEELQEFMVALDEPSYRGDQVFHWMHAELVSSFGEMTNLPLNLRGDLEEVATIRVLDTVRQQVDNGDGTRKYLLRSPDGELVETVLMEYEHGRSVCVSSQVGCRQGCSFCASTIGGLARNLAASEIVAQVEVFAAEFGSPGSINSVVFMGMGEPLDNYEAVVKAMRVLHEPTGMNMGYRHFTVSTSGVVPGIRRLAREGLPVTLAVSLHAPDDALRSRLMPVNHKYPLGELIPACESYARSTGRRVSFEYILIDGVNDSVGHARALAALLGGLLSHVNLIPVNPVPGCDWQRPSAGQAQRFRRRLEEAGIPTTLRRTLGSDIEAACGQLRRWELKGNHKSEEGPPCE